MIPINLFTTLLAVAVILLFYAIIDYHHKFYANVACAVLAMFTFVYLSVAIGSGAVYDTIQCSMQINATDIVPYDCDTKSVITDQAASMYLMFAGVFSFIYALILSAMAYMTYRKAVGGMGNE